MWKRIALIWTAAEEEIGITSTNHQDFYQKISLNNLQRSYINTINITDEAKNIRRLNQTKKELQPPNMGEF